MLFKKAWYADSFNLQNISIYHNISDSITTYEWVVIQVLAAYVKSIEDHGYILHFGQSSFTGFLPKHSFAGKIYLNFFAYICQFTLCKMVKLSFGFYLLFLFCVWIPEDGRSDGIKAGQLLQGAARSVDKGRKVIYMSYDPDMVSKYVVCSL